MAFDLRIRKFVPATVLAAVLAAAGSARGDYVTPMMGGGQTYGEMTHVDINFNYVTNSLTAVIDTDPGTPWLRPLTGGAAFDPAANWSVLTDLAYNSQYGWNPGGWFTIPTGAAIWIQQIDHTPGLSVYDGNSPFSSYAPVFVSGTSGTMWKWSGAMVHNTYAAPEACQGQYTASYLVYFADAASGDRAGYANYGAAAVTLTWNACTPHPGDANLDGNVDVNDLATVARYYGQSGKRWQQGDFGADGTVDVNDLATMARYYGWTGTGAAAPAPEPTTLLLMGIGALAIVRKRRERT